MDRTHDLQQIYYPLRPINDMNLTEGNYYYVVTAVDNSGNESEQSSEVMVAVKGVPATDMILPTVSMTSPVDGALVSGIILMTADASDNTDHNT